MARLKNSPFIGLRGTLGDMVFRTYGEKTFVYPKPEKPVQQTAAQQAARKRFTLASMQAKEMLMNDNTRVHYEHEALLLKLPNAYAAALRDQLLRMGGK